MTDIWYAYQETEDEREEGAWDGAGTENRDQAIQWLRDQLASGNAEAQVAVVDTVDSFCIETITTDDI